MKFSIASILALLASTQAVRSNKLTRKLSSKSSSSSSGKGKGKGSSCKRSSKGKGSSKEMEVWNLGQIVEEVEDLATLEVALETADLLDFFFCDADGVTVFAPTTAAFENIDSDVLAALLTPGWTLHLTDILLMHVVDGVIPSSAVTDGAEVETLSPGNNITASVNGGICFSPSITGSACVAIADVMASNGIAHVIDDVLAPAWLNTTVADIVMDSPDFTILKTLLNCTGLLTAVADLPAITVFAPTDAAFMAAGVDPDALCATPDTLSNILLYHVVEGVIPSVLIEEGTTDVTTLQGEDATITFCPDDILTINESNIVATDVLASNGIIHVIDEILLPPPPQMEPPSSSKGSKGSKGSKKSKSGKGSVCKSSKGKGSSYRKHRGLEFFF